MRRLTIDRYSNGRYSSRQILLVDNLLSPAHADHLNKSAISRAVVKARGYRTVCADSPALDAFAPRQRRAGILMPLWGVGGEQVGVMLRPDEPRVVTHADTGKIRTIKYEFPKGGRKRLDIPPPCRKQIRDSTIPLWVTEGVKKADSLASVGKCVVMVDGVWSWKSQGMTSPDWEDIPLKGREVILCFDSDASTNPHVKKALKRLKDWLSTKQATVTPVVLPPVDDDPKTGVDDYLAVHDVEALDRVVEESRLMQAQAKERVASTTDEYKALFEKLELDFRLNMLTHNIEVNQQPIDDFVRMDLRNRMRDIGFKRELTHIEETWHCVAKEKAYHPIADYLNNLQWDKQDHLAQLVSYFDEDTSVSEGVKSLHLWLGKWLVGAVAKALEDKPVRTAMLVLGGSQRIGKSTFTRWICPIPDLYVDEPINPDNKDHALLLTRKFVWEAGELGSTTRKRDRESLKAFLTKQIVEVRPAYARYNVRALSVCNFMGTINPEGDFFNDPTGNSRFMVSILNKIDFAYSKQVNRDQLWAQAVAMYRDGVPWELNTLQRGLQDRINTRYTSENPLVHLLGEAIELTGNDEDYMTIVDVAKACDLDKDITRSKPLQTQLGAALKEFGAVKDRLYLEGGRNRPYVYRRIRQKI